MDRRPWTLLGTALLMAACWSPSPSAGQEPRIHASELPVCEFQVGDRLPNGLAVPPPGHGMSQYGTDYDPDTGQYVHTSDRVSTSPEGVVTIASTGEECQLRP